MICEKCQTDVGIKLETAKDKIDARFINHKRPPGFFRTMCIAHFPKSLIGDLMTIAGENGYAFYQESDRNSRYNTFSD
jgi:hypothetical protein